MRRLRKRPKMFIQHNGQTKSILQLSNEFGIKVSTLHWRIVNRWPLEEALQKVTRFRPPNHQRIWQSKVEDGIEAYHVCMRRYFTKEFRMFQYRSLNRFYKEYTLGILKVA